MVETFTNVKFIENLEIIGCKKIDGNFGFHAAGTQKRELKGHILRPYYSFPLEQMLCSEFRTVGL